MQIGPPSRPPERLHVFVIAFALVLAAFTGGAAGLVWNWLAGGQGTAESATVSPSPGTSPSG